MRRAVLPVGLGLLLLATGCDRLFGIMHIDPQAPDAPRSDGSQPTTALVQQSTASAGNATMISATLADPPAKGDVLVMIGGSDRYNLATPTGGGVAAWAAAVMSVSNANVEIWYGITDGTNDPVTIACACTFTGNMRLLVTEWSGLRTVNVFETGSSAHGTSAPGAAAPGAITTVDSPDLIIFAASVFGSIASDATGSGTWTALEPVSVNSATLSAWYQLVPATGSYAPSTMVNGDWDAALAAFRAVPPANAGP